MKRLVVTIALASFAASASSQDGWVSVGATRVVAPASSSTDTSQPSTPATFTSSPSTSSSDNLVSELLTQVEQMQGEIANLRGQLEQQQAVIQRMERSQQDRYLDLDRRISMLATQPQDAPTTAAPTSSENTEAAIPSGDAYRAAMELVRAKKFPEARAAFDNFIESYPEDPLTVNAIYWAGEVSLVTGDTEIAEARFRRILDNYPEHTKAPDATYKLGVALHRKGDDAGATQYLNQVITQYSGKADSTVSLAKAYLKKVTPKAP